MLPLFQSHSVMSDPGESEYLYSLPKAWTISKIHASWYFDDAEQAGRGIPVRRTDLFLTGPSPELPVSWGPRRLTCAHHPQRVV